MGNEETLDNGPEISEDGKILVLDFSQKEYDYIVVHPKFDHVKFYCKSVPASETQRIMKANTGKPKIGRNGHQIEGEFNSIKFSEERWMKMVVNWDGLKYKNSAGNVIDMPCNEQTKKELHRNYATTLCNYVTDEVARLESESVGLDEGN